MDFGLQGCCPLLQLSYLQLQQWFMKPSEPCWRLVPTPLSCPLAGLLEEDPCGNAGRFRVKMGLKCRKIKGYGI